jgi:hypothetical protein
MRQRSLAQRPCRAQREKGALRLQQQSTRSKSKKKRRETCRLQDKEALALLYLSGKGANRGKTLPSKKAQQNFIN